MNKGLPINLAPALKIYAVRATAPEYTKYMQLCNSNRGAQ